MSTAGTAVAVLVTLILTMGPALAAKEATSSASLSFAEGPGLLGGQQHREAVFTIHAVGSDGVPVQTGGEPFAVSITTPEPTTAKVKDNHDGTYAVTYTPDGSGNYVVEVTLEGSPIRDAPFVVAVKPSASAANSFADGPGLTAPTANLETAFTIHAVDEAGNHRSDGGDLFTTDIRGPRGTVPSQTTDNENGTYTVKYTAPVAGNYTVKVVHGGKKLLGSPYHVLVAGT